MEQDNLLNQKGCMGITFGFNYLDAVFKSIGEQAV